MTAVPVVPAQAVPPGGHASGELGSYVAGDGRELRYQVVAAHPARAHLLYVHGLESHGGWFLPAAEELRRLGCTTWLLDRRGSGLNRQLAPGDARSAEVLLDDVRRMRAQMAGAGVHSVHLVGLSWGGKLATAAALDRPDGVRSLTLVAPGLRALVDLSWATKAAAVLALAWGGSTRFELPLRPEMFTSDERLVDFIRHDPWRTTRATARMLWASHVLDRRIERRIASLAAPVLLLLAGRERIVDNAGVLRLLSALPEGRVTVRLFEDATHALQLERTEALAAEVARFVGATAAPAGITARERC